jgi:hypothetical protein
MGRTARDAAQRRLRLRQQRGPATRHRARPQLGCAILLNPDTVVAPGAFDALLRHLDSQASIGIAGARIVNEDGRPEASAHRLPSPLGELEDAAQFAPLSHVLSAHAVSPPVEAVAHPCDWVSGACMAIRREVLDAVGPLDEGYFPVLRGGRLLPAREAGRLGLRLRARGLRHPSRGRVDRHRDRPPRRPSYWYESRRRFFVKAYRSGRLALGRRAVGVRPVQPVVARALGLGGKAGRGREPSHLAVDLLWGDLKAALSGEWRTIQRLPRRLHAG